MPIRTAVAGARLPLLITGDAGLLDDLLRLAAAGDTEVEVAPDLTAARPRYAVAPLVVVGLDQAASCLRAQLSRRPKLVIVGRSRAGEEDTAWEYANLLGAEHVAMLPAAEPWLVERFVACAREPAAAGRVVAVIGGRGGAGASVLAAGLAITGVRAGQRALLIDADPLGGGLDLVLGWENRDGLRWPGLSGTTGRVEAPALVDALPHRGDLVILSWDRGELTGLPASAMAATMDAARRGRDLIVVDLPRRLDDAAVLALEAADQALLVVPAELRAAASAARIAATVGPHCRALSVVVRGPAPGKLTARDVTEALGLPLAGTLRPEPGLSKALEHGVAPASSGRGPLAALCHRLLADLARSCGPVAA
jgi:secretion/DNA translocation related CpaE-like protein